MSGRVWMGRVLLVGLSACSNGGDSRDPSEADGRASADAGTDGSRRSDAASDARTTDASEARDAHAGDAAIDAAAPEYVFPGNVMDCTQFTGTGMCIASEGVRNGKPFSCMTNTDAPVRFAFGKPRWGLHCAEGHANTEFEVLVQTPGPVQWRATPGQPGDFTFYVSPVDSATTDTLASMTESSTNLLSGTLDGTLSVAKRLTGTFVARWGKPGPDCESGDEFGTGECAEGSVKMTFSTPVP